MNRGYSCLSKLALIFILVIGGICTFSQTAHAEGSTGIIYVGDTRVSGIKQAVSGSQGDKKSNEFFVSTPGGGYVWFNAVGISTVNDLIKFQTKYTKWVIVTNLGVYDLSSSSSYVSKYAQLISSDWKAYDVYFAAVPPCASLGRGSVPSNSDIEAFNKTIKESVGWKGYIDTYTSCPAGSFASLGYEGIQFQSTGYISMLNNMRSGISGSLDVSDEEGTSDKKTGESTIPGLEEKKDWGGNQVSLPTKDSLGADEATVDQWGKDISTEKANYTVSLARSVVALIGILVVVFCVLLYLAYWLDRVNNFVDINLLGVLTLGKLKVSPDDKTSTFNESTKEVKVVVHKDIIKVVFVGVFIGVMLLTGKVYWLISSFISIAKSVVGSIF